MKNKIAFAVAFLGLALYTSSWAAGPETGVPNYRATCENYAQEDQTPSDQMEAYMAQCIRDLDENHTAYPDPGSSDSGAPQPDQDVPPHP